MPDRLSEVTRVKSLWTKFRQLPKWGQIASWVAVGIVVLGIIGAASQPSGDTTSANVDTEKVALTPTTEVVKSTIESDVALVADMSEGMGDVAAIASGAGSCTTQACLDTAFADLGAMSDSLLIGMQERVALAGGACTRTIGRYYIRLLGSLQRAQEASASGDTNGSGDLLTEATKLMNMASAEATRCTNALP